MKAIILCGGQGTRIREHSELIPKPMVEIGGRPLLWHLMRKYASHGITEFIICLGYKGHAIRQFFLNFQAMASDFTVILGKPREIEFHNPSVAEANWRVTLVDTGENSMTGARVLRASRYLGNDTRFCLTYGDGLSDVDLAQVIKFHEREKCLVTVTGVRPPSRFGEMDIQSSRVASFSEKPQMREGYINGGFFVIEREFLRYLKDDDTCVLERQPLENCAADGQMAVYKHEGFWQCMDTYRDWLFLEKLWQDPACPWRTN